MGISAQRILINCLRRASQADTRKILPLPSGRKASPILWHDARRRNQFIIVPFSMAVSPQELRPR